MKIKKLDTRCGECPLVDLCFVKKEDDAYSSLRICSSEELAEMDVNEYKTKAEQIRKLDNKQVYEIIRTSQSANGKYEFGQMTPEEAFYIVGNIPVPFDDDVYNICQYQEAKSICLDATTKRIAGNAKYDGYCGFSSWTCPDCGHDVTNKPNFCPNCGKKLLYDNTNKY